MNKLELTILPTSFNSIKNLSDADGFIIGEADYALRLPSYFSHDEMILAIQFIKDNGQKVYVAINKIIHEYELEKFKSYIKDMASFDVDGFVFGDLAVFQMAKRLDLMSSLIYHPETYVTNFETVNFYGRKQIKRVSIAKEITLEDIKIIGQHSQLEVEVMGHGAINMFHSKRDLITNYFQFIKDEQPSAHHNKELYLIEEKRTEEKYPMIEDQNGTHIFSGHDLCTVDYLDDLIESGIKSIRIDGYFKTDAVLKEIVSVYRKAITDYETDKELYIGQKQHYLDLLNDIDGIRPFNTGFLFKKTVYKG